MTSSNKGMQESMQELEQLTGREFEITYINRLVSHHETALKMAQTVVDVAPHQEVRTAAARIIREQRQEIEELTGWLREWYVQEVQHDQQQAATGMQNQMQSSTTPEMAERMFLEQMRKHHGSAIQRTSLKPRARHRRAPTIVSA